MKTFEQNYKEKFREQIKEFIDKPVVLTNDINTKPLEDDPEELAVIIRTGPGTKSSKASYDLTTLTFFIDMITVANDLQLVLGAINSLILNYNAQWDTVVIPVYNPKNKELNKVPFRYKPIFTTPIVQGQQFNLRTQRKTVTAVAISMSVTVGYTSNAATHPGEFKLIIDNEEYNLNFSSCNFTSTPAYESDKDTDEILLTNHFFSLSQSYEFIILKQTNDSLHNLLSDEYWSNEEKDFLMGKQLQLKKDNFIVDISNYVLHERYGDGATVITLVLTR